MVKNLPAFPGQKRLRMTWRKPPAVTGGPEEDLRVAPGDAAVAGLWSGELVHMEGMATSGWLTVENWLMVDDWWITGWCMLMIEIGWCLKLVDSEIQGYLWWMVDDWSWRIGQPSAVINHRWNVDLPWWLRTGWMNFWSSNRFIAIIGDLAANDPAAI